MSDIEIKVSVFCIAFNHRRYIRRCLDNLINQKTDFRYEIIVHDDASTDGTREIIKEYAEKYPELVIPVLQEENQYSRGIDFVRDCMFSISRGKYVTACEGDDHWCDENKLQMQVDALESHPECVLCVHDTGTVDKDGNELDFHFPMVKIDHSIIPSKEFVELNLGDNWSFHFSAFMVSARLYQKYAEYKSYGFPSKFYMVGDLPFYLYFGLLGDIFYIPKVMSVYTMESGGFMSRAKEDPKFACKAHQGAIAGLTEFDAFSDYRFHDLVAGMLNTRRFEVARINRRFDEIVSNPEFRPFIRSRGFVKRAGMYVIGYTMLIFNMFRKKGIQ